MRIANLEAERVLADATGSTGGLGKIATLANSGVLYVRCDCQDSSYSAVDWRVKCDQVHDVQLYKARSRVDAPTLTISSMATTETLLVNGLTFTAHTDTNVYKNRQYAIDGVLDASDALELQGLINGGAYVTCASAAAADTVTVEGITFTAHASATSVTARQFSVGGTDAQDAAALALCINHKANVTCASVVAGDTVTINGITFTAHATTTTAAAREWAINGTDTQDGDALVTCINDGTYGVPGITAANASGVVSLTRNTVHDRVPTVTTSNGTRLAVVAAKGVPGYAAAVTDGGECVIYGTWDTADWPTVTTSNGTRLATGTYGVPGVHTSIADNVITITPAAAAPATVIKATTGTAGGHCSVSDAGTLGALVKDGAAVTSVAANSSTAGTLYTQTVGGWDCCYLAITNKSGGAAATVTVAATPRL